MLLIRVLLLVNNSEFNVLCVAGIQLNDDEKEIARLMAIFSQINNVESTSA